VTSIDLRCAPFVLLDDSRASHHAGTSLLFHSPDYIIRADSLEEIPAALRALDQAHSDGLHTAGWISYEVAATFEPKLAQRLTSKADEPLVWMIATKHRERLTPSMLAELFHTAARGTTRRSKIKIGQPDHDRAAYLRTIEQIQAYIQAGDVYQINHTFPLPVTASGDALALYERLRANQPVPYGAYIDTGNTKILSLSPELFLQKSDDILKARPMKGTAPRGTNTESDREASDFLKRDEKSRAENLMIVDLIRNDLSRIAAPASVKVEQLFETEKYPTLFQMTSTVTAKAAPGLTPSRLLAAMFPCGSVTGAPKVRAMEIIQELENSPRGIYCGTIGHFSPACSGGCDSWTLNVPIRTLCLNKEGAGRLNIGSGIVADSVPLAEYEECLLKARFIQTDRAEFSLIETMRLKNGRFRYLERHLARLQASADYFDFKFDAAEVKRNLDEHAAACVESSTFRCRLLLDKHGHCSVTSMALEPAPYTEGTNFLELTKLEPSGTVILSLEPTGRGDVFLHHKTTRRNTYDRAIAQAAKAGHLDMIFQNENGALTEGAISTLYIKQNGMLVTPPVSDGLLPGIHRAELIASLSPGQLREKSISLEDIHAAEAIYIGNAVRGLRRVVLAEQSCFAT